MRSPYKFTLGQKVIYNHPHSGWGDTPMRIIVRTSSEALCLHTTGPFYTIEPWKYTGKWAIDRPTAQVWEHDLKPWKDADHESNITP